MKLFALLLSFVCILFACDSSAIEPDAKKSAPVSFTQDIKPIFLEMCVHCHNKKTLPNRVSFESRKRAFKKSKSGVAYIVPGDSNKSLMITALKTLHFHEKSMPMVGPRPTKEQIELIRKWIDEGAPWPRGKAGKIRPSLRAKE